jgi:hypothetical protein
MNTEHDNFPRQHPALDRALREQIKAPLMEAAFRRQVMARIASQRAMLSHSAPAPEAVRSRLRAQLLLQLANIGAVGVATALLLRAVWPSLSLTSGSVADWGLPMAMAAAGTALLYGLHRARLLGWVRALGME